MDQSLKEVLLTNQTQTITLKEILSTYDHIELSEEEKIEGLLWAKRKKEDFIRLEKLKQVEEYNRKIKDSLFHFDVMRTFMITRAKELFNKLFILDEYNENIFNLFCFYHTNNPMFVKLAEQVGIINPSLNKGILLAGKYGTGKSWMMKLFQKSVRQVYFIRHAKEIAQSYVNSKLKEASLEYTEIFKNAINDASLFNQPVSGLCIDDIGTEDLKNNFGNLANVIGDIIEERYIKELTGTLFHGTTNLNGEQLKEYYGGRITSRMREIFNFIELKGGDRRK